MWAKLQRVRQPWRISPAIVPYSANATLDEYFNSFSYGRNTWLFVTTAVTDRQYLMERYITHSHFKKLPDNSRWDPTQCKTDEPR